MLVLDQLNKSDRPLRTLAWGIFLAWCVLLAGLWRIQILSADRYRAQQAKQSFRTVRLPALRGSILDRHGAELVGNAPRYRVNLYLEELRPAFESQYRRLRAAELARRRPAGGSSSLWSWIAARFHKPASNARLTAPEIESLSRAARFQVVSNTVAAVSLRLGASLALNEQHLQDHYLARRALPLALIPNCTAAQVSVITEQGWSLPGVALEMAPVRHYPYGSLAAHLLGHLQGDDSYDEDEGHFTYRLPDYRGGIGLEAAFDRELRGAAGARSILVNSAGYRQPEGGEIIADPQPGLNLATTIDLDTQRVAEDALAAVRGEERGAVIVLDPQNGDVLAMASAPSFNPVEFLDGVGGQRYRDFFLKEPERPLFNRATYGEYAPGSTFKIIHSLALLENGLNPAEFITVESDPRNPRKGVYYVGRRPIRDTADAGQYDFRRAFIRSSNSYFIHFGLRLGFDRLLGMGRRMGLGEPTGIRIGEEKEGDFPSPDQVAARGWTAGNLANVSIGQEITVTPLQMAIAVAAVANGGKVYWPRIVQRLEPQPGASGQRPQMVQAAQLRSEIHLPQRVWDVVRAAMRDDVADDEGSGRGARVPGFAVCGKTGTAEIKSPGRKDKVTWFVSFAPYEAPRYVVVVMVESGASGGLTCAPVARQIYARLHERESQSAGPVAGL